MSGIHDPLIFRSTIVLIGLLTLAQILIKILQIRKPGTDLTEVKIRTRSWWIMILLLEIALYLGKGTTIVFIAIASFFSLREYLSYAPTRVGDRRVLFWVFFAIPVQFYLCYRGWFTAFLCFIPLYTMSWIAVRLLLTGQPKGFVTALSTFQLGLLTTVYSLSFVAYLPFLDNSKYPVAAGTLLFFYTLTQINDVFQFLSGKTFGRQKIMPLISPKKTLEGFIGGVILTSLAAAIVAPYLTPLNYAQGFIAGILLSTVGFFGDVLLSAMKRDLGIKDFSQIIPGHGGALDRIDSLIISAPLFFLLIRYLTVT